MKRDLTGQKFGYLTAKRPTDRRDKTTGSVIWECECDCGNICYLPVESLVSGNTKSCGCYRKKRYSEMLKKNREVSYIEGTSINAISNKVRADNTSGVKGVSWNKKQKAWIVRIGFKGERIHVGSFKDFNEAVKARQEAEEKFYKPFLEKYKKREE